MEKTLSIAIPSFNAAKFLPETIPTFLDQRVLADIEILIVNDGSTDNTCEIANRYKACYPETISVINKENGGHGSAINAGIRNAKGKYFKVVDADDWVDTEAFCALVKKLKVHNEDIIISPFRRISDEDKTVISITEYEGLDESHTYALETIIPIAKQKKYAMHSLTIKTEILKKIKPIREHCFYVDMEYIAYPLKYAKSVAYVSDIVYQYRVGNAGQSMAIKNMQKNRGMHLNVLKDLISYHHEDLRDEAKCIIRYQIRGMSETQFNTILSLPISKAAFIEIKELVRLLKSEIPEACMYITGKKARLLLFSNGALYWVVCCLNRIKNNGIR